MIFSQTNHNAVDVPALVAEADMMRAFLRSLLCPEANGHAVPPHIRDAVRRLLGMKPVEGK